MRRPDWWTFVLLALAAYRAWRIIGLDTITEPARVWLTGISDDGQWEREGRTSRDRYVWQFLACPWCLGWWISLAVWGLWLIWPTATVDVSVPLAISAVVGLVAKSD